MLFDWRNRARRPRVDTDSVLLSWLLLLTDSFRLRVSRVAKQHAHRGDVGRCGPDQVQRNQRVVDTAVCR